MSSIGDTAFNGCTGLTSVTFPKSVINIGASAFAGCTALADVTIPKETLNIKAAAFSGTKITTVTVNKICSVKSDSFPSGTEISYY